LHGVATETDPVFRIITGKVRQANIYLKRPSFVSALFAEGDLIGSVLADRFFALSDHSVFLGGYGLRVENRE
jgi:hypothetical protein